MPAAPAIVELSPAAGLGRPVLGGKAAALAELSAAGFAVPSGFVVTPAARQLPDLDALVSRAVRQLGGGRFAVRSSGVAEDLPEASYAGLYETYLNVASGDVSAAVRRCFAAADSERVRAYHHRHGAGETTTAVLVQTMVDPVAAGVAFTAHPVTGVPGQTVVTAVAGLGETLVSGAAAGEEWTVTGGDAVSTRAEPSGGRVLSRAQATAVAELARAVADRRGDEPQDVEWAVDAGGVLWLLQARPMTAVPDVVPWGAPGPGLWVRNFRLGEWLPEAVTPLFATWLLPVIEDGYLDGMRATLRFAIPFRYAVVNGWYYNATPIPTPALLARVLRHGRAVPILYNVLVRVGRDPAAADEAVLARLYRCWRDSALPAYERLVAAAEAEAHSAPPARLDELIHQLGRQAGIALWYLAVVGGSAWKMEACLIRFARRHLSSVLPDEHGGAQVLLRGLPGTEPQQYGHAVHSLDWYHPVAAELVTGHGRAAAADRHAELASQRTAAERRCSAALATQPSRQARFERLLRVTQRYAVIREEQARQLTLAWPALRTCVKHLGGQLTEASDVFFCTHAELRIALTGTPPPAATLTQRRRQWQRQRRLAAPLTLGRPPRWIGDVIARTVAEIRGPVSGGDDVIVGQPASAGQATGAARIVHGPQDFATFNPGEVLVAQATAPLWTPLFGQAAAVVTDGGTLAAHASLVAREYGIPAVVGTGNATHRIDDGQRVTVDGTNGTVTLH
ncbi:MAG TPA: PEP/pyruvate-binding domain-containing protein [Actinoplanes sp.]|nr:PEP/pyruvate-binding domain-containing protein [Actinoplanes sp.]